MHDNVLLQTDSVKHLNIGELHFSNMHKKPLMKLVPKCAAPKAPAAPTAAPTLYRLISNIYSFYL